ncbi:MAG: hypothetical protein Q8S31_07570 [Alphaproteobacteria bacterium]|nr:hypothetical protein [Alphaproteobacteria bacterium]
MPQNYIKDFTLDQYKVLFLSLQKMGYKFFDFKSFYENYNELKNEKCIIMRHDVDRIPYNAFKMAELENEFSIKSTYYFRHIPIVFNEKLIKKIELLGHEIGYHYETLSKSKGDYSKAYDLFKSELENFRKIVGIKTICMHGSPLSKYDNRDLWKKFDFTNNGIIAEPYISIDYKKVQYFTDTSRSWGNTKSNLRDNVQKNGLDLSNLKSTSSLIDFIYKNKNNVEFNNIIIQTHPERWSHSFSSHILSFSMDIASVALKNTIKYMRKK